jgi:hypothetical protein
MLAHDAMSLKGCTDQNSPSSDLEIRIPLELDLKKKKKRYYVPAAESTMYAFEKKLIICANFHIISVKTVCPVN